MYCDECKEGFIGLNEHNAEGCKLNVCLYTINKLNTGVPCFCFGVTDECSELVWRRETLMNMNSGWNITDFDAYAY